MRGDGRGWRRQVGHGVQRVTALTLSHGPARPWSPRLARAKPSTTLCRHAHAPGRRASQLTRAIGLTRPPPWSWARSSARRSSCSPRRSPARCPTITGILVAWSLAGVLTFLGAIVCAELASAFPHTGGVYVFLREAFSPRVAFMWGWANFWSIHSGIIAAIAMVCARYIAFFVAALASSRAARGRRRHRRHLGHQLRGRARRHGRADGDHRRQAGGHRAAARRRRGALGCRAAATPWTLSVAELTAVPLDRTAARRRRGPVRLRRLAHGDLHGGRNHRPGAHAANARSRSASLIVTACYIGLNAVYLYVLPLEAVRQSPRIAADVAQVLVGPGGASAVSALVVLSAIGALTGIVLAGPRMYLSMAQDGADAAVGRTPCIPCTARRIAPSCCRRSGRRCWC